MTTFETQNSTKKVSSKLQFFNNNFKKSKTDSHHQIIPKKYSSLKKFGLFKKNTKTPGSIKQVRGAQYPPMYNTHHKNTIQISNNNGNIDAQNTIIDIERLLQSIKDDEHRYNNQSPITNHPSLKTHDPLIPLTTAEHSPKPIKEWDQIFNIHSESEALARKNRNRINLLTHMINKPMLISTDLRKICWRGIPHIMRPTIWKLLLGYMTKNQSRRTFVLNKKRKEYYHLMNKYYNQQLFQHRSTQENAILRQIYIDVPRTFPKLKLFQLQNISNLLSRALYIWSLKHTATGYVQGINDLITPFVYIFLDEYLREECNLMMIHCGCHISQECQSLISEMDESALIEIEADSYWCLDHLIEGLQLNYTDNQPGIQKMNMQLVSVIERVNNKLYVHLKEQKIVFIQFSFRWMNCLLMRELSLKNIIRLWDTYLCEGVELSAGFLEFHVFVCAALLLSFADKLMGKEFAEIMLFLQALPEATAKWGEKEIETILSEAYVYQQLFGTKNNQIYEVYV